jgi:hypothetical protein
MAEEHEICVECANWYPAMELEIYGVCYFNERDFRAPTATHEEDECDCGRYSKRSQ